MEITEESSLLYFRVDMRKARWIYPVPSLCCMVWGMCVRVGKAKKVFLFRVQQWREEKSTRIIFFLPMSYQPSFLLPCRFKQYVWWRHTGFWRLDTWRGWTWCCIISHILRHTRTHPIHRHYIGSRDVEKLNIIHFIRVHKCDGLEA